MRFEDLKRVWHEEGTGTYKRLRVEDLAAARRRASDYLNHEVRFGIPLLVILLIVAMPLFAAAAVAAPRPVLAWSGAVLLWGWLASISVVWWKLWKAGPDPALPVRDAVHAELERLRIMERFRERFRWYAAPFIAGEILLFVGLHADLVEGLGMVLGFSAVILVLSAFARRKNRRDLQRVVRPLKEELESWTVDLEELDRGRFQEESR